MSTQDRHEDVLLSIGLLNRSAKPGSQSDMSDTTIASNLRDQDEQVCSHV